MPDTGPMDAVRIDKWLWAARFFKTRSLATDAVLAGHVQLNGARIKPSKDVRTDDRIELRIGTVQWSLVVRGVSDKRGPAPVARTLYEETPESATAREAQAVAPRPPPPPGAHPPPRPPKPGRPPPPPPPEPNTP